LIPHRLICLPNHGPLGIKIRFYYLNRWISNNKFYVKTYAYLKFENKSTKKDSPSLLIIIFTLHNFFLVYSSFPERDFGRNQLPDCSMSLSLRYTPLTSNLHVSIVGKLPPEFPLASSNACINHNRSGPSIFVYTQSTFIEPIQQSLQNTKSENIENVFTVFTFITWI